MEKFQTGYIETHLLKPPRKDLRSQRDAEYVRQLAEDIKARGQTNPITIDAENVVLAGETRRQALLLAGIQKAFVKKLAREMTEGEKLIEGLQENELRKPMTDMDRASAYQAIMAANGWNQDELAEALKERPSLISKRLSVSRNLLPELQALAQQAKLASTAAYAISRLGLGRADQQRELADKYVREILSRDGVEAEVARILKGGKKQAPKKIVAKCEKGSVVTFAHDCCETALAELKLLAGQIEKLMKNNYPLRYLGGAG